MKIARKLVASFATLCAVCCLHAADSKPIARVIAITDVETDDPIAYASWIKEYNDIAKARTSVEPYLRVYQTFFDGHQSGHVRVVVTAASVAELTKNQQAIDTDPAMAANRERLRGIRKIGARVLYQAVHFEGASPKGANNYSTLAVVSDEAGYLKAIDQLRGIFDNNGLKDVKISVYRVIAGRSDHSHRITISTPSPERLAAFLDLAATNPQLMAWVADSAKYRTVVTNTTSREITK